MCGITGIFSATRINKIEKRIEKMTESLKHRGPDIRLYKVYSTNVAFGHARLKILDLSNSANQPMEDSNGRFNIVFNGEIYNFIEIRDTLEYEFKTHTDTEVILAAILKKGIDWFLKKANGMFAIGLYDKKQNELYLIRDRFGIKPLYYTIINNTVVFSSEIKAILNSGLTNPSFNEEAIDIYLGNRYVFEPYTFFKGIYQLESSHYLKAKIINDKLEIRKIQYWKLPELNLDYAVEDEKKIVNLTEEKIIEAVRKRLISDVPLGTYLSGGIDSSLITAITVLNKKERINTYTIGFNEKKFNEFEYARLVAEKYNTHHHEIIMHIKDYMKEWERLIYYKDAPLSVPNEVPLAVMSRELKKKITVVLSGEGADELFGGYGKIFRFPFYHENNLTNDYYKAFINEYEYVPRKLRDQVLQISFRMREEFDTINRRFFEKDKKEAIFKFFHQRHIKGLLLRLDTTTMQASVEGRVPFLDHELIEFVYKNVPYGLKLRWVNENSRIEAKNKHPKEFSERLDIPKYILKKVAEKYIDKRIIYRKKMGFPVPLNHWIKNFEKMIYDELKYSNWLKPQKIDELIKLSKISERAGQILWMFINIEKFKKRYCDKNWKW